MKTFSIATALAVILGTIVSAPAAAQQDSTAAQRERALAEQVKSVADQREAQQMRALAEQAKAVAERKLLAADAKRASTVSPTHVAEDMQVLATIVRENVAALYGHAAVRTPQIPATKARSTKPLGNLPKETAAKRKDPEPATRQEEPKSNDGAPGYEQMLRRIYLDLAGTLPTVKQTSRWIADPRDIKVKHAELIDELTSDDLKARDQLLHQSSDKRTQSRVDWTTSYLSRSSARTEDLAKIDQPLVERLPGFGVVVQLKVPPPRTPVMAKPTAAGDTPAVSRWERTQARLRGDHAPKAVTTRYECAVCHGASPTHSGFWETLDARLCAGESYLHPHLPHPGPTRSQLVDALIETLAENGRHVRGLADDERVTVSLSYELPKAGTRVRDERNIWWLGAANQAGSGTPVIVDGTVYLADGTVHLIPSVDKQPPSKPQSVKPQPDPGATQATQAVETAVSSTQELTGDLLMKRGEFAKAIDAYRKALFGLKASKPQSLDVSKLPEAKRATLLPKLLAAYHAAERHEEAMALAKQAFKKTGKSLDPIMIGADDWLTVRYMDLYRANRPRGPKLPGRISVSVTKAQLNLLAKGTLSERDFARQVDVRIFDPTAGKGNAKEPVAPASRR